MRPFEVRPAEPGDMSALVELCLAARTESSVAPQVCTTDATTLAHQIGALTAAPGGVLLVASAEGRPVGLLLGRLVGPNPFTDEVSLTVEAIYVAAGHRRRGAGHALLLGATEVAVEAGAGHVYASPIPGARGMHRFLVQLGFTAAASYRVATTAALQRRLTQDGGAARRPSGRSLEDLIARRRQSRLELDAPEPATPQADGRRASISKHVRRAVQTRRDVESTTTIS